MVPAAIGLAAACVALSSAPTLADQVRHQEWWLHALHVTQAWRTTEGSGVTVAVLDTGTDPAQPDLVGSVLPGPDFTHSGETAASPYFYGHGTAVASLIAGHGHGTGGAPSGVVGVAPAARILSVRVTLGPADPLLADAQTAAALPGAIAAGIRYAARQGAQVIDLPLDPGQASADGSPGATPAAGGSAAEQAAIDYALREGAVLVAPAGDDGAAGAGASAGAAAAAAASNAVNYPAAYPGVISVGSFNSAFIKSPFSIRQQYVTLTAPGEGVIAATIQPRYSAMNSTSAASAIVAGIAALVKSQFPGLTPAQVTQALDKGTVFHPGGTTGDGSGSGTADAGRALAAAAELAGPGVRAGTAALPRVLPVAPPLPTVRQPLTSARLLKDGIISGALLILLLLLIAVLAALRRRRDRRSASGAADELGWERSSATEGSQEERELAYLAAPSAQAAHATAAHVASSRRPARGNTAARENSGSEAADEFAAPGYAAAGPDADTTAGLDTTARLDTAAAARLDAAAAARPDTAVGPDTAAGPETAGASESFTTGRSPAARARPGRIGQAPGPGGPGGSGDPDGTGGFPDASGLGDPERPAGPSVFDIGQGGFTGSSSFTGLSPRAGTLARPSAAGQIPRPVLAPVTRPPSSRAPKVSGAPPWEPAVKPDSELPWASAPAPQPSHGRGSENLHRRPGSRSVWDTAHQDAGVSATDSPSAASATAGGTGSAPGDDGAEGQIYVWNPGATTETFPFVPHDKD
jgi:hypothetical protein